jgi:hypothetical protein
LIAKFTAATSTHLATQQQHNSPLEAAASAGCPAAAAAAAVGTAADAHTPSITVG